MSSNTNVEPTQSNEEDPQGIVIMVDIIRIPEGHEVVESNVATNADQGSDERLDDDDDDDDDEQTEIAMGTNQWIGYVDSLSALMHFLDDFGEDMDARYLEAAIQESLQTYACFERKPEMRVDVAKRIASGDEKMDTCAICQQAFVKGDALGTPSCKHDFHFECLIEWGHYKAECPICKDVMVVENSTSDALGQYSSNPSPA